MAKKAGMIHSVASLVPVFNGLAGEIMPDVEIVHLPHEEGWDPEDPDALE